MLPTGPRFARLNRSVRSLELSSLAAREQMLHQRPKFLVGTLRASASLLQPLEFTLGHRVEIDAPDTFLGLRALQPTEQNLGGARITDRALTQTTFDLGVGRGLTLSTRCTARRRPAIRMLLGGVVSAMGGRLARDRLRASAE